jgi:peptidoglycan/LPS O-acetylase OafA/YrhL
MGCAPFMPRARTTALPYVPALDGVRAIAVAGVLLYHAGVAWLPAGFLGVDVFFVLSGFLITSLLLAELDRGGRIDLRRFWSRRARRLLPAAFLVIAVTLAVVAAFYPEDAARTRADALSSFAYVNNWHQILADRSYFEGFQRPSLLQHLWSLAVEEQFYLLWPLALGLGLARLGRRRLVQATAVAAVVSAVGMAVLFEPGGDPSRVYFGTDTHATGLLVGVLLAFAWPLGRLRAPPGPRAVLLLDVAAVAALALLFAAMAAWHDFDPAVYRGGLAAVAVVSAVLVAAAAHPACRVARGLGAAPLRWIGERSYGIYLWHWPVMALTRPGLDLEWSRWVLVPLQIGATVALAAASYRWVEQPIRSGAGKAWLDRRPPRGRLAIAVAAVLAVTVSAVWVAGRDGVAQRPIALAQAETAAATTAPARPRRPLAVGASVMLAARAALGRHANVDAKIGRQTRDVIARLESYRRRDALPDRVIVQLGENGPIFDDDIRALRRALSGVPRVVLVTVRAPRSWTASVNAKLAEAVTDWPQARLADWYGASAQGDLLYGDATHPNERGQRVYAQLVERALRVR